MYYAQKAGIDMAHMQVPMTTRSGNKSIETMFSGIVSRLQLG